MAHGGGPPPFSPLPASFKGSAGFTLVELLVVMGIMVVMMVLALPAFNALRGAGDVTKSAYDLAGTLEMARAHAMANNTYVWVGFYEEDGSILSATPATPGTGRVILSTVASKDGTALNTNDSATGTDNFIDGANLVQVNKLVKIENAHLALIPVGTGTGDTLDTRPAVHQMYGRYGEINGGGSSRPGSDTQFPFLYPATSGTDPEDAQYVFRKTLRFNPRGEAMVNSTYSLRTVVEIGIQKARGSVPDTADTNLVAVQITGVAGNVKVYRR